MPSRPESDESRENQTYQMREINHLRWFSRPYAPLPASQSLSDAPLSAFSPEFIRPDFTLPASKRPTGLNWPHALAWARQSRTTAGAHAKSNDSNVNERVPSATTLGIRPWTLDWSTLPPPTIASNIASLQKTQADSRNPRLPVYFWECTRLAEHFRRFTSSRFLSASSHVRADSSQQSSLNANHALMCA